jgi:hypothetical protein
MRLTYSPDMSSSRAGVRIYGVMAFRPFHRGYISWWRGAGRTRLGNGKLRIDYNPLRTCWSNNYSAAPELPDPRRIPPDMRRARPGTRGLAPAARPSRRTVLGPTRIPGTPGPFPGPPGRPLPPRSPPGLPPVLPSSVPDSPIQPDSAPPPARLGSHPPPSVHRFRSRAGQPV